MAGRDEVSPEVRELAQAQGFGAHRRTFRRSATVTFLQGGGPLLLGVGVALAWVGGLLDTDQWWLLLLGLLGLVFGLVKTGQAVQARRSPVRLFQAGLIAGPPGRLVAFHLNDVDVSRQVRKDAMVQVVYTLRRRSDGRVLRLETVLHVERLIEAVLAGPVPGTLDEARAADEARRQRDADERAELRRYRVPALLLTPVALVLAGVGLYFLLVAGGDAPECNGTPMSRTDRCVLIDDDPGNQASYSYDEMRQRTESRDDLLGAVALGLAVLCAAPAALVFIRPRRLRGGQDSAVR